MKIETHLIQICDLANIHIHTHAYTVCVSQYTCKCKEKTIKLLMTSVAFGLMTDFIENAFLLLKVRF